MTAIGTRDGDEISPPPPQWRWRTTIRAGGTATTSPPGPSSRKRTGKTAAPSLAAPWPFEDSRARALRKTPSAMTSTITAAEAGAGGGAGKRAERSSCRASCRRAANPCPGSTNRERGRRQRRRRREEEASSLRRRSLPAIATWTRSTTDTRTTKTLCWAMWTIPPVSYLLLRMLTGLRRRPGASASRPAIGTWTRSTTNTATTMLMTFPRKPPRRPFRDWSPARTRRKVPRTPRRRRRTSPTSGRSPRGRSRRTTGWATRTRWTGSSKKRTTRRARARARAAATTTITTTAAEAATFHPRTATTPLRPMSRNLRTRRRKRRSWNTTRPTT
mmetsp:Transcript_14247/g.26999  ORF Transcript_14247/g.26999 Transcript_14247/m.26999 type:complete len:331 (+) Transcript_14247:354-1346(+)